jgi:ubiquinone/menaquinone biosynthesis C-methylase UbiE
MSKNNNVIDAFTELSSRYEEVLDNELSRFWGWGYDAFVDYQLRRIDLHQDDRILDIATGTAVIPRKIQLSGRNHRQIHALDITFAMLTRAKGIIAQSQLEANFCFVCASAMELPYANGSFDIITCSLASHHMDINRVASEIHRILAVNGAFSLADVGGYPFWNVPGVKLLIKPAAFIYYCFRENFKRAWAEAEGVSNIRTIEDWYKILQSKGYANIQITKLDSKHFWIPKPILIKAKKLSED